MTSKGLEAKRENPQYVIYNRTESMVHSIASDAVTFGGLCVCIWFSQMMGGGVWEVVTLVMFFVWISCKMPWETLTRTKKLHTKADAMAWAESLPDDSA